MTTENGLTDKSFAGDPPVRLDDVKGVPATTRRVSLLCKINPLPAVLSFVIRHWRELFSLLVMVSGGYLVWTGFNPNSRSGDMREWIKQSGDADLLRYYEEAKDAKKRSSLGVAFKAYEKRYGKGAWVQHFKEENPGENIAYRDIAELAIGMSTAEERDEFLAAHAATYETCVQNGEIELARRYGNTLKELRGKGGKDWSVVSRNPFAICVYDAVQNKPDLWNWYLDNAEWCDPFLRPLEPELQEEKSTEGVGLAEAVEFVRKYSSLFKQFAKEINALSEGELKEIADGDNMEECKENYEQSVVCAFDSVVRVRRMELFPVSG